MQDDQSKPSETDAQPDRGSPRPKPVAPGTAPKRSEADAQPDKPVSSERDGRH